MKKLLIALDYSTTAEKIAETGYQLAKAIGAEVTLLHVVADAVYYSSLEYSPVMGYTGFSTADMVPMPDVAQLRQAANDFLDQSKTHLGDETINTIISEGDCAEAILETANKINADIIVLGSHSRHGLDKILMGSVSEKVFHHTAIPLFVVPTKNLIADKT